MQAAKTVEAALQAGYGESFPRLDACGRRADRDSLRRSIAAYAALGASHVSAYLLKIEDGTPYARRGRNASLAGGGSGGGTVPGCLVNWNGTVFPNTRFPILQKPGMESRHNLKYWRDMPYLGFGPAAHLFCRKRLLSHAQPEGLLCGAPRIRTDGAGGSLEEFFYLGPAVQWDPAGGLRTAFRGGGRPIGL